MTPEKEWQKIPLLEGRISTEQLITAMNTNIVYINMLVSIVDKMTLVVTDLTKRVMAAEEKEG